MINRNVTAVLLLSLLTVSSGASSQQTKAFPRAEGYAQYATGGRGGKVVVVNTTKDVSIIGDGLISLREALEGVGDVRPTARYVVFGVGGLFDVTQASTCGKNAPAREIRMCNQKNVTVACQSAPEPGVNIRTMAIRVMNGAEDLILRHCSIRGIDPGRSNLANAATPLRSVLDSNLASRNLMYDHMSLTWATDEGWVSYLPQITSQDGTNPSNITLSNSIIAEGDPNSTATGSGDYPVNYRHSLGPSCSSSNTDLRIEGCSFSDNFIAHNGQRNLKLLSTSGEFVNNIVYDWGTLGMEFPRGVRGLTNYTEAYAIANLFKAGPGSRNLTNCVDTGGNDCAFFLNQTSAKSKYLIRDNHFIPLGGGMADIEPLNWTSGDQPIMPLATTEKDILSMAAEGSDHLKCVGASVPVRDAIDERLIDEFHAGTGGVGIFTDGDDPEYRDQERRWYMYPDVGVETFHPENYDTDSDGMADAWEREKGLDPNIYDANGKLLGGGYDNIEHFINELADSCYSGRPAISAPGDPKIEYLAPSPG